MSARPALKLVDGNTGMQVYTREDFAHYVKKADILTLDVGCGGNKTPGSVGMDVRALPGVDAVHDLQTFPWPFADETFDEIIMSHVMEHVEPKYVIHVMNEMWRVMKVGGVLMMAMPYPGSHGHWQDPTHYKPWNETTPHYFDPEASGGTGELYNIYKPAPWEINGHAWRSDGNIEIGLRKRPGDYVPERDRPKSAKRKGKTMKTKKGKSKGKKK